jgi:hypothetical protein
MNNIPTTLHFFVRHNTDTTSSPTSNNTLNGVTNSTVETAQYYFILREVDNILRISTTTDQWTFNNKKRSEQSIRTVINQVANQGQTKLCTIEELRALKSLGMFFFFILFNLVHLLFDVHLFFHKIDTVLDYLIQLR